MHDRDGVELSFRYATAEDVDTYYGGRPEQTLQAVAVFMNGEVSAILGLARHQDHAQFFSEFREALRPHLQSLPVMRAIKCAQSLARRSRLPVYAIAEETEKDSRRILARLGFVPHHENVFKLE